MRLGFTVRRIERMTIEQMFVKIAFTRRKRVRSQ